MGMHKIRHLNSSFNRKHIAGTARETRRPNQESTRRNLNNFRRLRVPAYNTRHSRAVNFSTVGDDTLVNGRPPGRNRVTPAPAAAPVPVYPARPRAETPATTPASHLTGPAGLVWDHVTVTGPWAAGGVAGEDVPPWESVMTIRAAVGNQGRPHASFCGPIVTR